MDLLTIFHNDFTLSIECPKYKGIWDNAVRNVGEENLTSTYSWSDGVTAVEISDGEQDAVPIEKGVPSRAVFFDNADYPIWVDFGSMVKDASFGSDLQSVNESFSFRNHVLAGFLNYGNDIGKSEIVLQYHVGQELRTFTFGFEVLSTKLNYHEHWAKIIEDIESEYRLLSLDYMRRTFHSFSPQSDGSKPDLVWWNVFETEQKKFIDACRSIIERPRRRLHGYEIYQRADKLKTITPSIENEFAEHRKEPAHLYRIELQVQSNDTQENRFLKFALSQITNKYDQLKRRIEDINKVSDVMKARMQKTLDSLIHLQRNPFFRTIGRFKGLTQESLVLQKAMGYSQVYRTWNLLRRAYSLNDGMYRLRTKDIATLYEIWCFIEVSHIVKKQFNLEDKDVDHQNRMEMNGLFTWSLGKGEHSRILFKKDSVELAELVYNPKHTEKENDSISMENLVVQTVAQKPDIVLQLTKDDMRKGMKLTYLFDAKYRIGGRDDKNIDVPPDDAINQLHRFRDAIYYKQSEDEALKREVIGGYILFPGNGQPKKFEDSIKAVNIGAFPLRPKDEVSRKLLEDYIAQLIASKSSKIIEQVIPQKGVFVEVPNRVLIGLVVNRKRVNEEMFDNGSADLYYTGSNFPTTIALHDLHFFIPYIKGKGIRDVYEVKRVRTITAKEAKGDEGSENDLRLAFELEFNRHLFDDYKKIDTSHMSNNTFIDTTFDAIDSLLLSDKDLTNNKSY